MTLTFDLKSYFSVSTRYPRVRDMDWSRSKRCEGESIPSDRGVSHAVDALRAETDCSSAPDTVLLLHFVDIIIIQR